MAGCEGEIILELPRPLEVKRELSNVHSSITGSPYNNIKWILNSLEKWIL